MSNVRKMLKALESMNEQELVIGYNKTFKDNITSKDELVLEELAEYCVDFYDDLGVDSISKALATLTFEKVEEQDEEESLWVIEREEYQKNVVNPQIDSLNRR